MPIRQSDDPLVRHELTLEVWHYPASGTLPAAWWLVATAHGCNAPIAELAVPPDSQMPDIVQAVANVLKQAVFADPDL